MLGNMPIDLLYDDDCVGGRGTIDESAPAGDYSRSSAVPLRPFSHHVRPFRQSWQQRTAGLDPAARPAEKRAFCRVAHCLFRSRKFEFTSYFCDRHMTRILVGRPIIAVATLPRLSCARTAPVSVPNPKFPSLSSRSNMSAPICLSSRATEVQAAAKLEDPDAWRHFRVRTFPPFTTPPGSAASQRTRKAGGDAGPV
jgi:hypothetical protein